MNKNSTNNLCYLGIFFLVVLIVIPPIFRVVIPKEESVPAATGPKSQSLTCTWEPVVDASTVTLSITSSYIDDDITKTVFQYQTGTNPLELVLEQLPLFNEIDRLKDIAGAQYSNAGSTYTIIFDYSIETLKEVSQLQIYQRSMNDLKLYFENQEFRCTVS